MVLDQALAAAPGRPSVLLNRANALNEMQRFAEALESADRALFVTPDEGVAHLARGNALAGLGRPVEAIESFRVCLRLAPRNDTARFNLATVLVYAGRARRGPRPLRRGHLRAGPATAGAMLNVGHLLAGLNRWAEAAGRI